MKDKIKEIREYISCPQFGDDHYGKWGALRLDQRKKIKDLLDYITNLQESEAYYYGQYKDYKLRNEKAIEYIKNNIADIEFIKKQYNVIYDDYVETTINDIEKLLNILQGEYK